MRHRSLPSVGENALVEASSEKIGQVMLKDGCLAIYRQKQTESSVAHPGLVRGFVNAETSQDFADLLWRHHAVVLVLLDSAPVEPWGMEWLVKCLKPDSLFRPNGVSASRSFLVVGNICSILGICILPEAPMNLGALGWYCIALDSYPLMRCLVQAVIFQFTTVPA